MNTSRVERGRESGEPGDADTTTFKPVFTADWHNALFIHFRIAPRYLQPIVPLPLDLRLGHAYVSLVAFRQRNLQPVVGNSIARRIFGWLSKPLAEHAFLNLRTYVRHENTPGILFLSEWIPNRMAQFIGPRLYGLPYWLGRLDYRPKPTNGRYRGRVAAGRHKLEFNARFSSEKWMPAPTAADSESNFLLERYFAFTHRDGLFRRFQVAHEPWPQIRAEVDLESKGLLEVGNNWFKHAEPIGGHYSPGVDRVGIGPPLRVAGESSGVERFPQQFFDSRGA